MKEHNLNNEELVYKSIISQKLYNLRSIITDKRSKPKTLFETLNFILSYDTEEFSFYNICEDQGICPADESKRLIQILFMSSLFTKLKEHLNGDFKDFTNDIKSRFDQAKNNIHDPLH